MFRVTNLVHSKMTARLLARVGAGAAMLALVAPLAGAGPEHRRDRDDGRDYRSGWHEHRVVVDFPIVIGRRPVFEERRVVIERPVVRADVLPGELRLAAYRSRDTIVLIVNGTNRGAGFITSLTGDDLYGATPCITLRNTPTCETAADSCATPFTLSASLHTGRAVCDLTVRVAGQVYRVPVVEAPSLS